MATEFQSPSLRGSGRFERSLETQSTILKSFNPLHCGAVVASGRGGSQGTQGGRSQSPSLRGSGRFAGMLAEAFGFHKFQSPSLRGSGRFTGGLRVVRVEEKFQSPSLRGSGRF